MRFGPTLVKNNVSQKDLYLRSSDLSDTLVERTLEESEDKEQSRIQPASAQKRNESTDSQVGGSFSRRASGGLVVCVANTERTDESDTSPAVRGVPRSRPDGLSCGTIPQRDVEICTCPRRFELFESQPLVFPFRVVSPDSFAICKASNVSRAVEVCKRKVKTVGDTTLKKPRWP